MKKTRYTLMLLLLIAALAGSACQAAAPPSGGGVEAPTQPPSATNENTNANANANTNDNGASGDLGGQPLVLGDVSEGLGALDSYRSTFSMSFEGADDQGQPVNYNMTFEEEFQKEPPAKRTVITGLNQAELEGGIETIEVEGMSYTRFGDTCIAQTSEEAPTASLDFTPSSIIGGINATQFVGNETVNGIPTRHLVTDASQFVASLGYTEAKADVWVAEAGNFVVKYIFEGKGSGANLFGAANATEGTIRWDYEVSSVNQPLDIQAPEDCAGAPEDIPLMPDAQDTSAFGEITTYTSPSALADVVAFYRDQMPANGWREDTSGGGFSTDQFTSLTFTKEGRTATLTISFDASSNTTTVLIQVAGK